MPKTAAPIATTATKLAEKKPPLPPRDPAREVLETIVFVVVLVLLLKLFVTEAFVIPTGSMAETLYGYQKIVKCPKCGHEFPVNSHDEVEGNVQTGRKMLLYGFTCPNCRYLGHVDECDPVPKNGSGDRVLVLKPLFHIHPPHRGDVVVFKYPDKPQEKHTASNYIKRAMGFGGETAGIHRGDLFVTTSLTYPDNDPLYPRPVNPLDLWRPQFMYSNVGGSNPRAMELFERSRDAGFPPGPAGFGSGGFEIVRKGEKQLLADRRIVWDNDQQPAELAQNKLPARWYAVSGTPASPDWTTDNPEIPKVFGHDKGELHWIRYRHLAQPWKSLPVDKYDETPPTDFTELAHQQPTFIDNFLGYNAGMDLELGANGMPQPGMHAQTRSSRGKERSWVGDLILECKATFNPGSEVVLELSKSVNRFQAKFSEGKVTLDQIGRGSEKFKKPERACKVKAGSTHELRFANVDCRLFVWVDGKLIDFGTDGDYQPVEPIPSDNADPEGWTKANDIDAPASIGAQGKVNVKAIKLHRDIYYTREGSDPKSADIFYVQPGHYLCLGDNSAQSSDSRTWGTVPERLMIGKAVFIFYPIDRIGFIK